MRKQILTTRSKKIGGKQAESLGNSKDVKSVSGEIADAKGKKADVLNTPVYIVAMEESTKDAQRVAEMLEKMVRLHGSEAVGNNVHITPGMNVAAWPKKARGKPPRGESHKGRGAKGEGGRGLVAQLKLSLLFAPRARKKTLR